MFSCCTYGHVNDAVYHSSKQKMDKLTLKRGIRMAVTDHDTVIMLPEESLHLDKNVCYKKIIQIRNDNPDNM